MRRAASLCASRAAVLAAALAAGPAFADGAPADEAPPEASADAGAAEVRPAAQRRIEANDVFVTPGEPATLRVALGHINRVATPFAAFDVWTESPEEFRTRGHVFYIAPKTSTPITLYLTPKDDERLALALTLVPEKIPPAEINLRLSDAASALILPASLAGGGAAAPDDPLPAPALANYDGAPHEEAIAELLRAMALGDVPAGFGAASMTAVHPRCVDDGAVSASFARGQRYVGAAYEVFVGVATNRGGTHAPFIESRCAGPDVAAVAAWPAGSLAPGAQAEVYVVRRRAAVESAPERRRPSLIAAGAVR